jgi:hypothetical protein
VQPASIAATTSNGVPLSSLKARRTGHSLPAARR